MQKTVCAIAAVSLCLFAMVPQAEAMTREQYQQAVLIKGIQQKVAVTYTEGLSAYKAGNYSKCLRLLTSSAVEKAYRNKLEWNIAAGMSYYRTGNYSNALGILTRAWGMGGSSRHDVAQGMGMSYLAIGNWQQAAAYLGRAAKGNNPDDLWNLSLAYRHLADNSRELSTLIRLLGSSPQFAVEPYYRACDMLSDHNELGRALSLYQQGIQYFPKEGGFYYGAGHVCFLDGNYEGAIPWLLDANKIIPDNLDILYDLGFAYFYLDRLDEAAEVCDIMGEIAPDDSRTRGLVKAVQQKILQRQMEQQMQIDQINQTIQEQTEQANQAAQAAQAAAGF